MPNGEIPRRPFGKTGASISALGIGGHHLGQTKTDEVAVEIVHRALDAGITFFDNCWEYHNGKSEQLLGRALAGKRERAFLMTKVCTHGRDGALAMRMLEQSLRRLKTDHLDLWQIHGASFDNDPELFIRQGGAAEALTLAKKQGKVRFVGFTGHKSPRIHLGMLATGFTFDAVQMPLNAFDASFRSFEKQVLPELQKRGIAALGMKSMGGHAEALEAKVLTGEEALRYAMSLPVATTISGCDSVEVLEKNLAIARGFQPWSEAQLQALRDRLKPQAGDGRFELYKLSLKFDNPEARLAHEFPLDMQSDEVKERMKATDNSGHPFPEAH